MIRRIVRRILGRNIKRTQSEPIKPTAVSDDRVDEVPSEDSPEVDLEVDRKGLEQWLSEGEPFELLDIREPYEYRQGILRPSVLIPMNDIPEQLGRLDKSRRWVVVCAAGMRSFGVAHYMREHGFQDAWSMVGGLGTWADQGYGHAPNGSNFGLGDWVRWSESGQGLSGRIQWIESDEEGALITVLPEQGSDLKTVKIQASELKRN